MKKTIGGWIAVAVGLGGTLGVASRAAAQAVSGGGTVYTANSGGSDVSALDAGSLQAVHANIVADISPQAVAVSPDGTRVYSGNVANGLEGLSSITVIDAATNEPLTTQDFDTGSGVSDLVVSPDGTLVYATLSQDDTVEVLDTVTFGSTEIHVEQIGLNNVDLEAVDVSADGMALFALDIGNATVVKAAVADGSTLDSVAVSPSARELKVSTDGATLIVVGDDAAQFFSTATLDPIAGAFGTDLGEQVDVAVAGGSAYVLNQGLVPAPLVARGTRGGVAIEPSIDVYDVATGAYVRSFMLGASATVNGIAVLPDGSRAFVSDDGDGTNGAVRAVSLTDGTIGPTGSTGVSPRRVAVKPAGETLVLSYFLPRAIAVKLHGAGKDTLVAAGFYDDGGLTVDYSQPVTIDVGGFEKTFTLVRKGKGYAFKDTSIKFVLVPNLKASSRGRFRMRIAKTTLAGLVDPAAAVDFHFHATGLPDARGTVTLTAGKYHLGKKRGALLVPAFFPANTKAKVGGPNLDSLSFRGGFATDGQTPTQLGSVRFGFGPTFSQTIAGSEFPPPTNGSTFKITKKDGAAKFLIAIDFLREVVVAKAKNVELGPLTSPTIDIQFDAGTGAGPIRNTVRFATKGAARLY